MLMERVMSLMPNTLGLFPCFGLCSTDNLQCSDNYLDNSGNKPAFAKRSVTVQMENSCSLLDNIFCWLD